MFDRRISDSKYRETHRLKIRERGRLWVRKYRRAKGIKKRNWKGGNEKWKAL